MLDKETVGSWRGHEVVDRDGDKIGKIGDVYLDSSDDRPMWVTVKTGLFGRRETFVPIAEGVNEGEMVRVPFEKEHVKEAPSVAPDAQLSAEEETELYRHYGLDTGTGQAGGSPEGDRDDRDREGPAREGHGPAGRDTTQAGAEGQATERTEADREATQRTEADRGETTGAGQGGASAAGGATDRREGETGPTAEPGETREGAGETDERERTGDRGAGSARDDLGSGAKVHQLSEEPRGGEQGDPVEGRLRLKKYVVKEEVRIPVEREETRIERE